MRNYKSLIIIAALFIVCVVAAIFFLARPHHSAGSGVPKGLEKGSATNVVSLSGTERLTSILTIEQFIAVRQALTTYIEIKAGESVISAEVLPGSTVVNNDGSVNFTVTTKDPTKTLKILLQRPSLSLIIFSVVGDSSSASTLYPYGPPGS